MTDLKKMAKEDKAIAEKAIQKLSKEAIENLTFLGNDIFEERKKHPNMLTYSEMQFMNEDRFELRGYLTALRDIGIIDRREWYCLIQYFSYFDKKHEI